MRPASEMSRVTMLVPAIYLMGNPVQNVGRCLGISGVDPLRYDLIMERFLSPLRRALPDIDIDVESARRLEVYDKVFADFGAERVAAVAMLDTYRVRHAIRDVGAAMSLPPGDIDAIASKTSQIATSTHHARGGMGGNANSCTACGFFISTISFKL